MRDRLLNYILSALLCLGLTACGAESRMAEEAGAAGEKQYGETAIGAGEGQRGGELLTSGDGPAAGENVGQSEQESGSAGQETQGGDESTAYETAASEAKETAPETTAPEETGYDFTVCFAGDINLDESWCTTQFMDAQENGIYDCISPELIQIMNEADIMCLNNEFTYSTGGVPLEGKAYTFRAKPERVEILGQLGVDAVTLANNHVYDYGPEALLDTFAVLEEAGIPYFGAGRTLEEAMAPLYLEAGGKTIALVGASRAEKNRMTPQATDSSPGILRCYDTELYLAAIAEASENADFCIAFVHWGTEYSFELEQVQTDTGREYLDAGADVVIGAHSHCLQGLEFYDGKPIIYSLGNYWFNEKTLDTMLVQLQISGDATGGSIEVQLIPAVQSGCRTVYASEPEEQRRIFDFLESISVNVEITDEGLLREAPAD